MLNTIINLLIIAAITALVAESEFFYNVDDWLAHKLRFYHLGYIFFCPLCQTTWLGLLYVIVTGHLSLLSVLLCILAGFSTRIIQPLYKLVENILMGIIGRINDALNVTGIHK